MTHIAELVIGPIGHAVVDAALNAPAGRVVRFSSPQDVEPSELEGAQVVHIHFTDGLFGCNPDIAAAAFCELTAELRQPVVATLHDLPLYPREGGRYHRRRAAYACVERACSAVVVSSRHEARALSGERPFRVVPLPLERKHQPARPAPSREVGILGWVYPGKGHEDVLSALPEGMTAVALGAASPGHDDLLAALMVQARGRLRCTGFLESDALEEEMRRVAVPVAAHRAISASASIGHWLTLGRRPLVSDNPWTRELAERCPGSVTIYPADGLAGAITRAMREPDTTWLGDTPIGPGRAEVAAALSSYCWTFA